MSRPLDRWVRNGASVESRRPTSEVPPCRSTTSSTSTAPGCRPAGSDTIDVHDSTNGEVIAQVPAGTADDVDAAAKAARAAFESWSQTTPEERAKYCTRIAEGLGARMDEIATVVTREAGMPKWLSLIDPGRAADQLLQHGRAAGRELRVREPAGQQPHHAGARRRGRGHHAVELPAAPGRRQGRLRDRRRLHRRAQAQRGGAARRLHPGRGDPRRRAARRGVQPGDRHRPGRRGGHRPPSRRSTWCRSPGRPGPASGWPSSRRSPSSGWRWSWGASRPTCCSTTSTTRRSRMPCVTASASATSTRARPAPR